MMPQRPVPKRPVNLDLTKVRFPITALASISHRISGLVLYVSLIFLLLLYDRSLESNIGFAWVGNALDHWFPKLFINGILVSAVYHGIAGTRHLLSEFLHMFEDPESGPSSATAVFVLWAIGSVVVTWWWWS